MTNINVTPNFSPNSVFVKAQNQELADTLLAACSYSPPIASSTRRKPDIIVSYLKFSHHPSHLIPTG
ncbi:MAG: hypothetical protein ACPGWR_30170, partial [Ardenticatenaceae bacterium]